MGAGEERRKLLCQCGKPLGIFTAQGLELYCRFSKETTTVPYTISNLEEPTAFVEVVGAAAGDGREDHERDGASRTMDIDLERRSPL